MTTKWLPRGAAVLGCLTQGIGDIPGVMQTIVREGGMPPYRSCGVVCLAAGVLYATGSQRQIPDGAAPCLPGDDGHGPRYANAKAAPRLVRVCF